MTGSVSAATIGERELDTNPLYVSDLAQPRERRVQLRRMTRSVFTGSNRPVRAIDHKTRQAPRVARSQYVWQRNVPQNFAFRVVRATLTRRGRCGVRLSIRSCVTMPPPQIVRPGEIDGNAPPSRNQTG